jgi:hypothetical protein
LDGTGNCFDCNGDINGTSTWDRCGDCDGQCIGSPPGESYPTTPGDDYQDYLSDNACYNWNGGCFDCEGDWVGKSAAENIITGYDDCGICSDNGNQVTKIIEKIIGYDQNGAIKQNVEIIFSNDDSRDCHDTCFGEAYINSCNICVGGQTGLENNNGQTEYPWINEYGQDCAGICANDGGNNEVKLVYPDVDNDGLGYGEGMTLCTNQIEELGYSVVDSCSEFDSLNTNFCIEDPAPECGEGVDFDDCRHCNGFANIEQCNNPLIGHWGWYYLNGCYDDPNNCGPDANQPCCNLDCNCECIDFEATSNVNPLDSYDDCGECYGDNSYCTGCMDPNFDTYSAYYTISEPDMCFDDLTDELINANELNDDLEIENTLLQTNLDNWNECNHTPNSDYTYCVSQFINAEDNPINCGDVGCVSQFPNIYIEGGELPNGNAKASLFGFVVPNIENLNINADGGFDQVTNIFNGVLYDSAGNQLSWSNGDLIGTVKGTGGNLTNFMYYAGYWRSNNNFTLNSGMGLVISTRNENAAYIRFNNEG